MNKLLFNKLIQHNKIWLPITIASFIFLTSNNLIFYTFYYIFILFIVDWKISSFSQFRYDLTEENNNRNIVLNLLPIDSKKYNLYSYINAIIWSTVLFIFLIFASSNISNAYTSIGFITFALLLSFIQLLFVYIDNTKLHLSNGAYYLLAITNWLVWLTLMILPSKAVNSIFNDIKFIPLILLVTLIPLIVEVIDKFFHKLSTFIDNKTPILSNINLSFLKIHNLSKYNLVDSKSMLIQGPAIVWIVYTANNLNQYTFIILFLNLLVIISNTYNYYNKQTLIRLAPISLNQKKMACNITTISTILVLTIALTPILGIIQNLTLPGIIHDCVLYSTISLLIYTLVVIFIHTQYNLVSLLYLVTAGTLATILLFNYLDLSNLLTVLLPIIFIIVLLAIDYYKLDMKK